MTRKKRTHRDFQEFLIEHLSNHQEAAAYLKAALADEDERAFLLALRDVLKARSYLPTHTHIDRTQTPR